MQVSLNEVEVRQAVNAYIRERLRLSAEEHVTIEMVATRGSDGGCKAVIEIVEPVSITPASSVTAKAVTKPIETVVPATAPITEPATVVESATSDEPPVVNVAIDAGGDVLVDQSVPAKPSTRLFGNLKTPT